MYDDRKEFMKMGKLSRFDSFKTLGKYRLMEKLRDDSLGPVYKSYDRDLDRAVEIRIFCDGIKWDKDLTELLQKAYRSVTRIQHPNIASIIELKTEGTFPYMVLEPLGKRNLRNLAARTTKMSFESKISIMMQLTQGLAFAHKNAIIHRNLCPENIYLKANGCIKIRDFALSHVLENHLPHPGVRYGAPIYLSPEQIEHKQFNEQSDIFALGTVSYELLTGSHPFYDADSNKLLDNILEGRPIPTFDQYPHFHPRIWHILKKCLEKKPEDRYRNADEILKAFQEMLKEMAEDVQLMLAELQVSFAPLKTALKSPNATGKSTRLYRNIWNILRGVDDRDFVHLDKLVTDLNEIYPEIQAFTRKQDTNNSVLEPQIRPVDLYMFSEELSPVEDKGNASSQEYGMLRSEGEIREDPCPEVDALSDTNHEKDDQKENTLADAHPKTASADECVSGSTSKDIISSRKDSMNSGSCGHAPGTARELHDEKPDRVSSVEVSIAVPSNTNRKSVESDPPIRRKRRILFWKNERIPKRRYRMVAVLLLILLAFGFMHIFQRTGDGKTTLNNWMDTILDSWMIVKASVLNSPSSEDAANASISVVNFSADDSISDFESALMDELEEEYPVDSSARQARQQLAHIRALIEDGALNQAEEELDRVRRVFPGSSEVEQLYELLQQKIDSRLSSAQSELNNFKN